MEGNLKLEEKYGLKHGGILWYNFDCTDGDLLTTLGEGEGREDGSIVRGWCILIDSDSIWKWQSLVLDRSGTARHSGGFFWGTVQVVFVMDRVFCNDSTTPPAQFDPSRSLLWFHLTLFAHSKRKYWIREAFLVIYSKSLLRDSHEYFRLFDLFVHVFFVSPKESQSLVFKVLSKWYMHAHT